MAFIKPRMEMTDKYSRVLKEGYVSKEMASSLIVIKTVTGMAMAVAVAIDHMELPGVVGCIAGDDTIMCALRSREDAHMAVSYTHLSGKETDRDQRRGIKRWILNGN